MTKHSPITLPKEKPLYHLNGWLSALLPNGACSHLSLVKDFQGNLYQTEEKLLSGMSTTRRREFVAGRTLSRFLLAALGCPSQPVLRGYDGMPIWPDGYCGSITHKQGVCGAIVAKSEALASVGLDLEFNQPLTESVWKNFINEGELEDSPSFDWKANILFSCKEAAFKCLSSSGMDSANIPLREILVTFSEDSNKGFAVACHFRGITLHGRAIVHRRIVLSAIKMV